jgi:hypothetical protein
MNSWKEKGKYIEMKESTVEDINALETMTDILDKTHLEDTTEDLEMSGE